ncbi:LysR substrate-binding domain-containing protein [Shewanella sp. 3B26]|uniref:LysR substrate-binding domain-containing protein n=1 Tax=Shewanella zhuhaiensis TaxID=2919576 RepID=A0AAJ1BIB6_9GAMM|nr:LysR substrate-binding domain-containing protein [Shewanella zhuhaiensis]MCH4295314.1 LysR substrate-binding domain-containing protein [Shewanella zhuhaiensis]
MRKLPPLRALQVFEAAARHLHFSRAATELCLTQSAVSHQVRALEQHLGQPLFSRKGRELTLTGKGQQLFLGVQSALDGLDSLCRQLNEGDSRELRLAVYSSFAVKWLIPRLSDFRRQHPGVRIHLEMVSGDPQISDQVADMFICGVQQQKGFWQTLLRPERLIPVCSPPLAQMLKSTLGESLTLPASLDSLPLLSVDEVDIGPDWQRWAETRQLPLSCSQLQSYSHVLLAIEAAIAGQGVALACDFIVEADIAAGKLVALPWPALETGFGFHFGCRERRLNEPAMAAFAGWIKAQARAETI